MDELSNSLDANDRVFDRRAHYPRRSFLHKSPLSRVECNGLFLRSKPGALEFGFTRPFRAYQGRSMFFLPMWCEIVSDYRRDLLCRSLLVCQGTTRAIDEILMASLHSAYLAVGIGQLMSICLSITRLLGTLETSGCHYPPPCIIIADRNGLFTSVDHRCMLWELQLN